MAFQFPLRRITSSCLRPKALGHIRSASVFRSFKTNAAQVTDYDESDLAFDVDRRDDRPVSRRLNRFPGFADVFDPLRGGSRKGWNVKEDEEALYLRMDMPGLGKENVKVLVENNTLIIKGEGEDKLKKWESGSRYSSRLDLPTDVYKLDSIKAEMKNGVLNVMVTKVEDEESKNVMEVHIE